MSTASEITRRRCACAVLTDEQRAAQRLPPGFCGRCRVCGEPGHLRPRPGPAGRAAAWCDTHYQGVPAVPLSMRIVPVLVSITLCLLVFAIVRC